MRGFGRFLGGDFKRRRIVLRRTGSPCFAIIEWHHGDGDDTGGGHRWMPLGPTETRVREGGAAGDDATRCRRWWARRARSSCCRRATRRSATRGCARRRGCSTRSRPPRSTTRASGRARGSTRSATRRRAPRRARACSSSSSDLLRGDGGDAARGRGFRCTRSTRCSGRREGLAQLPPQAAERLQAGRAPPAVGRRAPRAGPLCWQRRAEHVEGAAVARFACPRLRRRRERARADADRRQRRGAARTREWRAGGEPRAAPAAAPEGDESAPAATSRDGAVSIDAGARWRAVCRRACRSRSSPCAATSWSALGAAAHRRPGDGGG